MVQHDDDSAGPALTLDPTRLRRVLDDLTGERDALSRRSHLLAELLDTVDEGVVLWDERWQYLYSNAANSRLIGIPQSELVGHRLWDLFPGAEKTDFGRAYLRVMATGTSERLEAYWPPQERWIENLVFRTSVGVAVVARDVTERRRAQDELQRSAELERRLSAIVSHDLRNPLSVVRLGLDALLRRGRLDAADLATVGRMQRSLDRMQEIILVLLDATRAPNALPVQASELDLTEWARQTVEELAPTVGSARLRLESDGPLPGAWDAARLTQALTNLVSNAVQHGAPGGVVTVRLRRRGEGPVIEVHNLGPAIPADSREALFQPFRRGEAAAARDGSVGLGLFIVRQVAEAHGGHVEVASTEDDGTTFRIALPWRAPSAGTVP